MAVTTENNRAPGIRQRFPLPYGALNHARRDPLGFYSDMARRYGDVFRWDVGPMIIHLVTNPADVKRVLVDHQKNYPRSRFYKLIKLVTGEGLVTSEGDFWRRQRRMAQPAFQHQRLAAFAPGMVETIRCMLDRWQAHVQADRPFDIQTEMMR